MSLPKSEPIILTANIREIREGHAIIKTCPPGHVSVRIKTMPPSWHINLVRTDTNELRTETFKDGILVMTQKVNLDSSSQCTL
jgi:hypothetical protein